MSKGKYQTPRHVRYISQAVVKALDDGTQLLVIKAPPRHSKSETISRWLPTWYFTNYPTKRVVLGSYSAALASGNGRDVRELLKEHGGQFNVCVSSDSSAVDHWHTNKGGECISVGVGGSLTGFGGDLIIIDDVLKDAEEAESETIRRKCQEWFSSVVWTRRQPGALVIVMMTRWHEDDLIGYIENHPELSRIARVITLPAIAEENDELGRAPGEHLWPEYISGDMLMGIQRAIGPRWWSALYQQRPSATEGAEIKRQWWRWYDELPVPVHALELIVQSIDATFKDSDGSDFVVIQTWGVYGSRRYLLDQIRDRMGFVETVKALTGSIAKHKPAYVLVEAKANGDAIIDTLERDGIARRYVDDAQRDLPTLVPINPKASKTARVRACSPQVEAGNVLLPVQPWAEMLVNEAAAFPLGRNDDMIDCCAQALNWLADHQGTPAYELRGGDNRFVNPDIARERANADAFNSVLSRIKRAI